MIKHPLTTRIVHCCLYAAASLFLIPYLAIAAPLGEGSAGTELTAPWIRNSGTIKVGIGSTISVPGTYEQIAGMTIVEGELDIGISGAFNLSAGVLTGTGLIISAVENEAYIQPGSSIGELTILGTYSQDSTGTFTVELGGRGPNQSDIVTVEGDATLAGMLKVKLENDFQPQVGDEFTILTNTGTRTGRFDSIGCYDVAYEPNAVRLITREAPCGSSIFKNGFESAMLTAHPVLNP